MKKLLRLNEQILFWKLKTKKIMNDLNFIFSIKMLKISHFPWTYQFIPQNHWIIDEKLLKISFCLWQVLKTSKKIPTKSIFFTVEHNLVFKNSNKLTKVLFFLKSIINIKNSHQKYTFWCIFITLHKENVNFLSKILKPSHDNNVKNIKTV